MPANTHTPSPSASVFRTADTDVDWNATQQSVSALSRCCNDGESEERGQAWLCTGEDTAVWRQCPKSHTTLTESRRDWERRAHAEAYATRRPALREGQFAIIKKIQQNKKYLSPLLDNLQSCRQFGRFWHIRLETLLSKLSWEVEE